MTNWIAKYYAGIRTGEFVVGHWIRKWYERLITGIEDGTYIFDAKKAAVAISFIEGFCHHHEGQLAPGLIKLETWEKALISVLCGIVNADGTRQFREAVIVMGRKNGKTLLAAALCCYFAVMDGEYGGRIYTAATRLEQANLAYDAFFQMIQKEPEISDLAKKRRSDIYFPETNTSVRALSFSARKSDGFNISFCVCDEIASWQGERGIRFYEVLRSSFGARRQPLLLAISTAGYENGGIYDELIRRATSVLNGTSRETGLAPFLYMIDDQNKWDDLTELEKANPNLGVSIQPSYLINEIAIAQGSRSKRTEFLVKYCNVKQNASTAWLDFEAVDASKGEAIREEDYRGCYAVAGIDLARTTDMTAAVVVIEKDGKLHVLAHFWMPTERLPLAIEEENIDYRVWIERGFLSLSGQNAVDYTDVAAWLRDLIRKHIWILKVGYDRYSAQALIQDLRGDFQCDDVFQGTNLTPIINQLEGDLLDGRIDTGDNAMLRAHLMNAATKNEEGGRRRLIKMQSRAHIDGAAALLDALTMRDKYAAEIGPLLKNGGRKNAQERKAEPV